MDFEIVLVSLALKRCEAEVYSPEVLGAGGDMNINVQGDSEEPTFTDDGTAIFNYVCTFSVIASSENGKEENTMPVFSIELAYSSVFEVPEYVGRNCLSDKEFRWGLLAQFMCRIYPLVKTKAEEIISSMNVKNAALPCHIDANQLQNK